MDKTEVEENIREILEKKFWLDHKDIEKMFGVKKDTAYGILRAIRNESDTLHMGGRCTTSDFLKWFNKPLEGMPSAKEYWTNKVTGGQCDDRT